MMQQVHIEIVMVVSNAQLLFKGSENRRYAATEHQFWPYSISIDGSTVQFTYRFYDQFYSDWSPTSREYSDGDTPDRGQSCRSQHMVLLI